MALALSGCMALIFVSERSVRWLLLASISTYDIHPRQLYCRCFTGGRRDYLNYAPRQVSKVLLIVLGRLALVNAGKSMLKALPLVGVAIGSGMNKVLTMRIGAQCVGRLEERLDVQAQILEQEGEDEDIVDAIIQDEEEQDNA